MTTTALSAPHTLTTPAEPGSDTSRRPRNGYPSHIDTATIRDAARPQWPQILSAVGGVDIGLLDGKHHGCPKCGGVDRFRLIDHEAGACYCNQCFSKGNGDGFAALQWLLGKTFPEVLRDVAEYLGITQSSHTNRIADRQSAKPPRTSKKVTQERTKLLAMWQRAYADAERLVEYLASRGLPPKVPASLRLVLDADYWSAGEMVGTYPAMLARFSDARGILRGLHQTYLSTTGPGKAPVDPTKKARAVFKGALRGSAVQVFPAKGERLAVCEGIEDAISIHAATGIPAWAAGSETLLRSIEVPPHIATVDVFADADDVGQDAARELADRLSGEGRQVRIATPSGESA